MATDVMGGSFLATLESEDGVKLGFSRVVKGGDGQLKAEPQDCLYASTLIEKSLVVEFRYVRPEVYVLSCWGLFDSAFSMQDVDQLSLSVGHFDADIGLNLDSGPKQLSPWFEKSSEALWIGVDAKGCIVKTENKESALKVCIENATPQFVQLLSSTTKNYLRMIPLERLEGKQWCARMSDRDGVDALFKLRVIGVYAPDGEIQFT